MKKRYLILSTLIHIALVIGLLLQNNKSKEEQAKNEASNKISVELVEATKENKAGDKQGADKIYNDIIELGESGDKKLDEDKFYWGIGIRIDYAVVDIYGSPFFGYKITDLYQGYCGEQAGIRINDFIYLVNGVKLDLVGEDQDIKGDKPKTLLLTVFRNNVIINVKVDRCKIYY